MSTERGICMFLVIIALVFVVAHLGSSILQRDCIPNDRVPSISVIPSNSPKKEVVYQTKISKYYPPYQSDIDTSKKYKMFIAIKSMPTHLESRRMIRESWLRYLTDLKGSQVDAAYRFFVGVPKESGCRKGRYGKLCNVNATFDEIEHELQKEFEAHNDIVRLPVLDHFWNLSQKVVKTMEWSFASVKFDYFVSVDDDVFVQLDEVIALLKQFSPNRHYWGHFIEKVPNVDEKPLFHHATYGAHASGTFYGLSRDLVAYVVKYSKDLKMLLSDDAAVSYWFSPMRINTTHIEAFGFDSHQFNCSHYVTHNPSVDLRFIYNSIIEGEVCNSDQE
eukprot:TRINITY_DN180_c0_g1_i1.p1 TRINITY_DN180_c0_g1~~TRINITY_DN180_c0_g1_i1.p1  ORF type:complete len:333 (+),score=39.59 TRINITY_DN180_c0_g1_i1:169-1167(+)